MKGTHGGSFLEAAPLSAGKASCLWEGGAPFLGLICHVSCASCRTHRQGLTWYRATNLQLSTCVLGGSVCCPREYICLASQLLLPGLRCQPVPAPKVTEECSLTGRVPSYLHACSFLFLTLTIFTWISVEEGLCFTLPAQLQTQMGCWQKEFKNQLLSFPVCWLVPTKPLFKAGQRSDLHVSPWGHFPVFPETPGHEKSPE